MFYYRDKQYKLFEDDSNEKKLDNTSTENDSNNEQTLKSIDITSINMKDNFQNLLKLSKEQGSSVIKLAKNRFENKAVNGNSAITSETHEPTNSSIGEIQKNIEKSEDQTIQNVLATLSGMSDVLKNLQDQAIRQNSTLNTIEHTANNIQLSQQDIKNTQYDQNTSLDYITHAQRRQADTLNSIEYKQDRAQLKSKQ